MCGVRLFLEYSMPSKHTLLKLKKKRFHFQFCRFEDWENKNIIQKIQMIGIPLWNGMFCAIDPAYSGTGFGSMSYGDCMRIMAQVYKKNLEARRRKNVILSGKSISEPVVNIKPAYKRVLEKNVRNKILDGSGKSSNAIIESLSQILKPRIKTDVISPSKTDLTVGSDFSIKLVHSLALLNHRPRMVVPKIMADRKEGDFFKAKLDSSREENDSKKLSKVIQSLPMVIVFTHCQRAATFHQRHGFKLTAEFSYSDTEADTEVDGNYNLVNSSSFEVHVLLTDPFKTGQLDIFKSKFTAIDRETEPQ